MPKIKTSEDLRIIAAETIDKLLEGLVSPDQANAVAKLGNLILKTAIEEVRNRPKNTKAEFFEGDELILPEPEHQQKRLEDVTKPSFLWEDCGKLRLGQWQIKGNVYKAETSIHGESGYCLKVQLGLTNPELVEEAFDAKTMEEAVGRAESAAFEHAKSRAIV